MNPPGYLEQLRAWLVQQLQLFPDFAALSTFSAPGVVAVDDNNIPESVIIEKKRGDLLTAIQSAINKTGLYVSVEITSFADTGSQTIEPTYDAVEFIVEIVEATIENQGPQGSQLTGLFMAERVPAALKMLNVPQAICGGNYQINCSKKGNVNAATEQESQLGLDHWFCHFEVKATTDKRTTP